MDHFHIFVEEKALFARKFDGIEGERAVHEIDRFLLKDSQIDYSKNGGWIYNGYQKYKYNKDVVSLLQSFCKSHKIKSVLDIGCGAGLYVAALRRLKIPVAGYDANPYTPELSARLLPLGDEPCGVVDITDSIKVDEQFDLVICMDVLQYIPMDLLKKGIYNISRLSKMYVLVTCLNSEKNGLSDKMLEEFFCSYGMKINNQELNSSIHPVYRRFNLFIHNN